MTILEITNFKPFIPSTVIGLIGLISGYLYKYFKNKDNKKLQEIKSTKKEDRLHAIEAYLNELGVHIDTSNLAPSQKYNLLTKSLITKTKKYLLISITTIIISILVSILIWNNSNRTDDAFNSNKSSISIDSSDVVNTNEKFKSYAIKGKVIDNEGRAISDVLITVNEDTIQCKSSNNGSFIIPLTTTDTKYVRLNANKEGYTQWNNYIDLPAQNIIINLNKSHE